MKLTIIFKQIHQPIIRTNYMKYFASFLILFLLPVSVFAETVVRTGESVSIEDNQLIESDFYAAAGTVSMSGEVAGDMYVVGGTVTTNGKIDQDFTALAGSVNVHASTSDDVRVVAGEVVVAEFVGGDLFVLAGRLKVLSSATIAGNIFFYGGEAEISGSVNGSIMGSAETMRVDSNVGGSIDVGVAKSLTLGDRASVVGDVKYVSTNDLIRAQNAVVQGDVLRGSLPVATPVSDHENVLLTLFISLFATLSLYLVFRSELQKLTNQILAAPAKMSLVGLGTFVGAPLVIILLLVTVLGSLLGIIGLLGMLLLYILAFVLMSVLAAGLWAQLFTKSPSVNLLWILLGAATVQLLFFVPIVGPFAVFVLFMLALGGLVHSIYRWIV